MPIVANRRLDPHVAGLRDLPGGEADRALHEADERRVRRPVRAVHHLVQDHPRVGGEVERGAVDEADAEGGAGAGLDDVALVDEIADIEGDRHAVADRDGRAGDLLDPSIGVAAGGGPPACAYSAGVVCRTMASITKPWIAAPSREARAGRFSWVK